MRLSSFVPAVLTFIAAGGLSYATANYSVLLIEERSRIGVRAALDTRDMHWANVSADGLQVTLDGVAPSEALRFQAQSVAGTIVDAARVINDIQVEAQAAIAPPRFSVKILRNDAGISVIGLIPAQDDRDALAEHFAALAGDTGFTDLLQSADYAVPRGWGDAMAFALKALASLPRAKVEVEAGFVSVAAITKSAEEKASLERSLQRSAPPGLNVSLDIAAPRPVLTPFTLRFVMDEAGSRFDACSADTLDAQAQILEAAAAAGLEGQGVCTVGMGVPTPQWADAAGMAIATVSELGGGTVTFSNTDVSLVALEGTDQAMFDSTVGRLENTLPDVFALQAVLPQPAGPDEGPPEFVATLSPEGLVQLRGRIEGETNRDLSVSYAKSVFGSDVVTSSARLADDLPTNWMNRILSGLEALGYLSNGAVIVTPDSVSVSGDTGDKDANARIAQLLAAKLGDGQQFDIRVTYQEKLDPVVIAQTPTPQECEAQIQAVLAQRKLSFEPGSATIDAAAISKLDEIADILKACGDEVKFEIQGHTDSQGREEMNLALSQQRAQAILSALRLRRVRTGNIVAKGYGESQPIADNESEEGREANRRIAFRLVQEDGADDQVAQDAPIQETVSE